MAARSSMDGGRRNAQNEDNQQTVLHQALQDHNGHGDMGGINHDDDDDDDDGDGL